MSIHKLRYPRTAAILLALSGAPLLLSGCESAVKVIGDATVATMGPMVKAYGESRRGVISEESVNAYRPGIPTSHMVLFLGSAGDQPKLREECGNLMASMIKPLRGSLPTDNDLTIARDSYADFKDKAVALTGQDPTAIAVDCVVTSMKMKVYTSLGQSSSSPHETQFIVRVFQTDMNRPAFIYSGKLAYEGDFRHITFTKVVMDKLRDAKFLAPQRAAASAVSPARAQ